MIKSRITLEVLAPTTPKGEKVYLAGSLNAWKVGDPAYAFQEIEPEVPHAVIGVTDGAIRSGWMTLQPVGCCV